MYIEILQDFFFWCMVVNFGIYVFTALCIIVMRNIITKIIMKVFKLDEQTVNKSLHIYLSAYKLLITVFNFVPWIAILIIK